MVGILILQRPLIILQDVQEQLTQVEVEVEKLELVVMLVLGQVDQV